VYGEGVPVGGATADAAGRDVNREEPAAGVFVTSGLAGGVASPGALGRVAPPAATDRAAAVSAGLPVVTGRVGSVLEPPEVDDVELGGRAGDGFGGAGRAVVSRGPLDGDEPPGPVVVTLGDASFVIGDAPPPGICRDVVPDR
jgi:hypothetical protein